MNKEEIDKMKDKILEHEERICQMFAERNWVLKKCDSKNSESLYTDFELYDDNNYFYGYVDVLLFNNPNPKRLLDMIKKIKHWLDHREKIPLIFIITDGIEYFISFKGKPFETFHYIPSPTSYEIHIALIDDYMEYFAKEEEAKKDGSN